MYKDYNHTPRHISKTDKKLVQEISTALREDHHEQGLRLVMQRLKEEQPRNKKAYAELRFLLGGFLIDFGTDAHQSTVIDQGVQLLEADRENISSLLGHHSIDYCLGNAKYSLYCVAVRAGKVRFKPENLDLLTEAKNYFWQAIKSVEASAAPNLYVNLANALDTSGRVIEAIRWYSHALQIDPDFPMAHVNRGMALSTLNRMSDTYSISMLLQMEQHFKAALKDPSLPKREKNLAQTYLEHLRKVLAEHEVSETLEEHEEHTERDWQAASPFRRFCVGNHLTLNEHSLYCRCIGGQFDSLRIPKSSAPIGGDFVPSMELLLNRVRAEFALGRMLFYQYTIGDAQTSAFEAEYAELFDNEVVGLNTEYLRTSFRLCFGILDRIAFAVCILFDLADPNEQIYFESFWKKPKPTTPKEKARWKKINDADNWGLTALYSQAKDLHSARGEWGHFKQWRNRLEHEALLLTSRGELDLGPWIEKNFGDRLESVDLETFKEETLHLLQITAAAIFYFTFCVRQEGTKVKGNGPAVQQTIDKRERDS